MISTNKNGEPKGQLLSYYSKERTSQYLCLYTSQLLDSKINYKNSIIFLDKDVFGKCDNDKEVFNAWNKQFEDNGIFEIDAQPYKIEIKGITENNLKELSKDSGGIIFNQFAEILRRNVVSDKTNAFNKIFNLFICKIKDEDDNFGKGNVKMKFQWEDNKSPIDVFLDLSDLYKKGMKQYLGIDIKDHSREETDNLLSNYSGRADQLDKLKDIITELRLYKNNEFAFIEIFDEDSFNKNAKVVKEIVKLLEKYRIRYSYKQQFLGDFFEKLLNTGIKQEAGQFFTPIPIAKFICDSIPYETIIKNKIKREEHDFLPYVIDYASGSGHFLTEVMERIDNILQKITENEVQGKIMIQNLKKYKENFAFAKDYIYGVEKDYRLSKTSKVSCFLNGDGEANIFCSDGLNPFNCKDYKGILFSERNITDNPVFDSIIATPPYSVDSFKNTIKGLKESFELGEYISDKSDEIECLFVERTKQLLKEGGMAGLILPSSILNNGGLHLKTRELIIKYFNIKAIIELGKDTFMATGISTAILFLERKNNDEWKGIQSLVESFFSDFKDRTVNKIENIFSIYTKEVYNLSINEYKNNIKLAL